MIFPWTVWAVKATELLTYIQCHQSVFLSYALSECWQGGPHTLSCLCTLGGQCGVWQLSGHSPSRSPFFEEQLLPTAPWKQCSLKSNFKADQENTQNKLLKVVLLHFMIHSIMKCSKRIIMVIIIPFWSISLCADSFDYDDWLAAACAAGISMFEEVWSRQVHLPCSVVPCGYMLF